MCKQSKNLSSPNVLSACFFWRLFDLLIILIITTLRNPPPWSPLEPKAVYVMYVSLSSRLITLFERLRTNALCIPGAADAQWRDFRKATFGENTKRKFPDQ